MTILKSPTTDLTTTQQTHDGLLMTTHHGHSPPQTHECSRTEALTLGQYLMNWASSFPPNFPSEENSHELRTTSPLTHELTFRSNRTLR